MHISKSNIKIHREVDIFQNIWFYSEQTEILKKDEK